MNLFTTSDNPKACVQVLDDILLGKTILESAQMISTAIRLNDNIDIPIPEDILYKVYNANEEHNSWVRENQSNYRWAFYYLLAGLDEYQYRFDKQHDSKKIAHQAMQFEKYFPTGYITPFPRKFNKDYENYRELMDMKDTFQAYQKYLSTKWHKNFEEAKNDKRKLPHWTKREMPDFFHK